MKIPGKLKIGGRTVTVQYPHIFTDSCETLRGQCDLSGQIIRVSNINTHGEKAHPQSVEQAFMHEVLHAVDYIYNAGKIQGLPNGEDITDQMAEGIIQVIRDNKLDFSGRE